MTAQTVLDTPIGPLTLVADGDTLAAVRLPGASGGLPWTASLRSPARSAAGRPAPAGEESGLLAEAAAQLSAYFDGTLTEFDLPLAPARDDLAARVRAGLGAVGYGQTCTYGELATTIHGPDPGWERVRAVAGALARNPLAIVVPCHRVIGADGSLTGYGGGLERKRFLLELETPAERRLPTLF